MTWNQAKMAAGTAAMALLLTSCGAAQGPTAAPGTTVGGRASEENASGGVTAELNALGLGSASVTEIIDALDRSKADTRQKLVGSVRQNELLLTAGDEKRSLPMPADRTYVSVAPYRDQTHPCFNHNLATCQGEQVGQEFTVVVVDEAGRQVLRDTATTYDNGFLGFWLPRNIKGTLKVEGAAGSATTPLATGPEDPTCITTVKLS